MNKSRVTASREVVSKKSRKELKEIAEHNAAKSLLLRLPGEVKEKIYEKVTDEDVILLRNPIFFRKEEPAGFCITRWGWHGLGSSLSGTWDILFSVIRDDNLDYEDTLGPYNGHRAHLDLSYQHVCSQLTKEMEPITFRNYILHLTNRKMIEDLFMAGYHMNCTMSRYIQYLAIEDYHKNRQAVVRFVELFSRVPSEFPSLRPIIVDFEFDGSQKQAEECMPFKTSQEIELGMQTKVRKIAHDRVLQTIVKLLKRPLISADFSVGGGDWIYQQVEVWDDYVQGKIGKSNRKEKDEEWKAYVDGLSPDFCRKTGRRGDPRKVWRVVDEETSPSPEGRRE